MARNQTDDSARTRRGSCVRYGCIAVAAVLLALVGWIASGFIIWKRCRITLPDGSGTLVYMARLNKILCAEWDRQVRFETKRFHGRTRWVHGDGGGDAPINVYWYPAEGGTGPHLRLREPSVECFVDLKHGTTWLVKSREAGACYVGEMSSTFPKTGWTEDPTTGETVDTVDGHPVRRLENRVAQSRGVYLGRIEYPCDRFLPAEESPEKTPVPGP